jgi:hypothetical protein
MIHSKNNSFHLNNSSKCMLQYYRCLFSTTTSRSVNSNTSDTVVTSEKFSIAINSKIENASVQKNFEYSNLFMFVSQIVLLFLFCFLLGIFLFKIKKSKLSLNLSIKEKSESIEMNKNKKINHSFDKNFYFEV